MEKWRLVIERATASKWYSGWIPAEMRATNEGIIPDTIGFYPADRPGMYLQRYCDVLVDINYEECKRNNVDIVRGTACGGGVGYGEPGTEPNILMTWDVRRHPEIPTDIGLFYATVLSRGADVIGEKYPIPVRHRFLNDIEAWDPSMKLWRKVMGVGASGAGNAQMFAWFPMGFKQSGMVYKLYTSPKDKFADKTVKEMGLRTWTFEDAGAFKERGEFPSRDELVNDWIEITLETLKRAFNIETEPGEVTVKEREYTEEYYKTASLEQFIFASSAEKRFKTIPEGSALGKYSSKVSGGPLLRAYVLRRGDTIEDIMFTGTLQMAPSEALEDLGKELKGCKIDENLIRTKTEELFAKENVDIALGSASFVSDTIIQACKESYK
jgi:hypothetical protein